MGNDELDMQWMVLALQHAERAGVNGEVPVGALLVKDNVLIAAAGNSPVASNDPTAHAEILVLRKAAAEEGNYRLPGTTLYVTLEPCIMCVGAMIHARIERVVFGATDAKTGALISRYGLGRDGLHNHSLTICGGILEERCSALLKSFFQAKRNKRRP